MNNAGSRKQNTAHNGSPAKESVLPRKALAFARECNMFPPGASVLCALSGGADSVSLLGVLRELQEPLGLHTVAAAHVNHHLRGTDSDADEAFARSLCEKWETPIYVGHANVSAEAKRRRTGVEETARVLRYDFLEQTAIQAGFSHIATGHTADDNTETLLLHLVRGAGLSGLSGIPPVRGLLVRPLLRCTRTEVEDYLIARGLPHTEDITNLDISLARNRIRHCVTPELRVLNPRLSDAVSGLTARLRQDEAYIMSQAEKELASASQTPEGASFPSDLLNALPSALAYRVCRLLYTRAVGQDDAALFSSHTEAILSLCRGTHPSASISLPNGLAACRAYDRLVIGPVPTPAPLAPCILLDRDILENPDVTTINHLVSAGRWQMSITYRHLAKRSEPYHFFITPQRIQGSLSVRARQTGDRLTLPGKPGSKSLKRLMIDAKIPSHLRDAWPVIVDGTGPVAVPGLGVAATHRAAPGTPAIEITAAQRDHKSTAL